MARIPILAALLAVAASTFVGSAGAMSHPKLIGVVGKNDAFKITLKKPSGKLVRTIKAGTYTLVVHDGSALHNYELDGPHGKSWKFTAVSFKGTKTITLKLVAGKYKAYCSVHESTMFQHFRVTS